MPEKKATNKTPEQRFADIKRKLERLNENPEANKTEIEKLVKRAGQLLDEIEKTEKEEFFRMLEQDRKEAEKMEKELDPLIQEAQNIRAQLKALEEEEADLDKSIVQLEAKLAGESQPSVQPGDTEPSMPQAPEEEPAITFQNIAQVPEEEEEGEPAHLNSTTPDTSFVEPEEEQSVQETEGEIPQSPTPEKTIAKINVEGVVTRIHHELPQYPEWGTYNFIQVDNELVVQFAFQNGEVLDIAHADRELARAVAQGSKIARNELKKRIRTGLDTLFDEAVNEQEKENAEAKKRYDESSEAQKFISDFGLENVVPEAFYHLTEEQQLKTIQDLKNRIVDTVKRNARLKHNAELADTLARSGTLGKLWHSFVNNFTKELDIKKQENSTFEELRQSPEFEQQIASDLEFLTNANKDQIVIIDQETGTLIVDYTYALRQNPALQTLAREYNKQANIFRTTPYEWGQAAEGSHLRNQYNKATRRYEEIHARLLAELSKDTTRAGKQELLQLLHTYNQIKLDQFLSQHPDANIEFAKLGNAAGASEFVDFVQRTTGTKTFERTAILVGGAALRGASKMLVGWVAAPVVGAVTGALRGRIRAKETLNQKRAERRYGGEVMDGNQEISEKFVDAKNMAEHLGRIISELERTTLTPERKIALQKRLIIRIQITLEKLDLGLVNFGNTKESLANQYNLIQKLNEALAIQGTLDDAVQAEIENRVALIMSFREKNIHKAQKEYIKQQMIQGAKYGAGLAALGYVAKAVFDDMETTRDGGRLPEVTITDKAPLVTPNTQEVVPTQADSTHIAHAPDSTVGNPDTLGGAGEPPVNAETDSLASDEKINTGNPHINKAPGKLVHEVDETKTPTHNTEAKPAGSTSSVHTESIVTKGEGITHAFKQQIKADPTIAKDLAKQIGYEGRVGTQAFYKALGEKFGYINEKGEWIGVKGSGEDTAYQFEKQGDTYVVVEYHKEGTAWVRGETHTAEGKFEGKDFDKKYEYFGKGKKVLEKTETNTDQLARPTKPEEIDNGQLARAEKTKLSTANDNGQFDRAPAEAPTKEKAPEQKISTKDYWSTYKKKPEPVVPVDDDLYGKKKDIEWGVAPGPDGAPWVVEDFTLEGGKAIRLFADRFGYQDLTNKEVNYVGETYRYNLNRIFTRSEDWTDKLSMMSAPKLLRMNLGEEIAGDKEELSMYIKMLNKETGLKPFNDGWVGNKENAKDYILRMLLDLEYKGKLDTFNDKFDEFMKGR